MITLKQLIYRPPQLFYEHVISRKRGNVGFVLLEFFLLGFIMARLYVYLSILGLWPENFMIGVVKVHMHHFGWGILIVALTGFVYFNLPYYLIPKWRLKLAGLYGWGLGLIFDQFGMWLNLKDEYSLRRGYDAVIILAGLMINVVYFSKMWRLLYKKTLGKVLE